MSYLKVVMVVCALDSERHNMVNLNIVMNEKLIAADWAFIPLAANHFALLLVRGLGEAPLPLSLTGKYPKAGYLWAWQFVFPSAKHCRNPYTGRTVRYHVHEKTLQRTVKEAVRRARTGKPVGCHTFRHAFAMHLLESGHNNQPRIPAVSPYRRD